LLQVLEASGALLVAIVRTTPPQVRAHHVAEQVRAEDGSGRVVQAVGRLER
jgi:hypothetical protein